MSSSDTVFERCLKYLAIGDDASLKKTLTNLDREEYLFVMELAIRDNRSDLLRELLAVGPRTYVVFKDPQMGEVSAHSLAIMLGKFECLKVLRQFFPTPLNHPYAPDIPAFNALMKTEGLGEQAMMSIAEQLLELGANPFRIYRQQCSAIESARARSLFKLAAMLENKGCQYGPRYVQEARKRRIKDLCLYYHKADGFIFRVSDFDLPFFLGGDYDGAYPATLVDALNKARAGVSTIKSSEEAHSQLTWLLPILERIAEGKEVSLEMILKRPPSVLAIMEGEFSNWD